MLKVKIFADGADFESILMLNENPLISGFTTNPTLMKKSGIKDYSKFANKLLDKIKNKPISFEVFADDEMNMEIQANKIASWGSNVFVKIPVMNTKGENTFNLIKKLSKNAININVTAVFTYEQVKKIIDIASNSEIIISVFAGRIADTGIDPIPIMEDALDMIKNSKKSNVQLLWASPREVLNVYQAEKIGCHIITITNDLFKKLDLRNKNLEEYSKETVQMFFNDAITSKFSI